MSDDTITTDDLALILEVVSQPGIAIAASTAAALERTLATLDLVRVRVDTILATLPAYPTTAQYEAALDRIAAALYPTPEMVTGWANRA